MNREDAPGPDPPVKPRGIAKRIPLRLKKMPGNTAEHFPDLSNPQNAPVAIAGPVEPAPPAQVPEELL